MPTYYYLITSTFLAEPIRTSDRYKKNLLESIFEKNSIKYDIEKISLV